MAYKAPDASIKMFTRAIVRAPAPNFADGLTTADHLGVPEYARVLHQHEAYCRALEGCGLTLTKLDADSDYPDSTFVEDAAIITHHCAILTRPGASTRLGEIAIMRETLQECFPSLHQIQPGGTLDGGDVCEAGNHFFVGISARTNESGAEQLAGFVSRLGYTVGLVDIRDMDSILHLKSGISYLGDNRLVVIEALADRPEFASYELVRVDPGEEYAANCVRLNDHVLIAARHPALAKKLRTLKYQTIELEMSEFQKMDGGLSCLSLRF